MKDLLTFRSVALTAAVTGVASLVVLALLVADGVKRLHKVPTEDPEFVALREALAADPGNQALRDRIRQFDAALRREYEREQHFTEIGAYLLLTTVLLTVLMGRWAATMRRRLPTPQLKPPGPDVDERLSRTGVYAVGVLVVALLLLVWAMNRMSAPAIPADAVAHRIARWRPTATTPNDRTKDTLRPKETSHVAKGNSRITKLGPLPPEEEYAKNWPAFRGPYGNGISPYTDIPMRWDVESGDGVVWKTEVALPGANSPIVWQDRVFISGATAKERRVFCFNAFTGELIWEKPVSSDVAPDDPDLRVTPDTGYAASTMATDGRLVYAIFATGDLVAFDFDGNLFWHQALGVPQNHYGHASSLTTYDGAVIVQFDQGTADDDLSKLLAIDGATGKTRWEAKRQASASWSSPVRMRLGGSYQLITCSDPAVIAYDPADGTELWRVNCLERVEVGPSPVAVENTVFVANDPVGVFAIRADGQGDVTQSNVLWNAEFNAPDVCSPLVTDEFVLVVYYGLMTCYDKKKGGDPLWEEELGPDVVSSPSLVGDKVYCFGKEGEVLVLQPTRTECKRVAEFNLGEECVACPAFQPGRLYVRGKEHLFCIGKEAPGNGE